MHEAPAAVMQLERPLLAAPAQLFRVDFMFASLFGGRRLYGLTVIDDVTAIIWRSRLARDIRGEKIPAALEIFRSGQTIATGVQVDNDCEFVSMALYCTLAKRASTVIIRAKSIQPRTFYRNSHPIIPRQIIEYSSFCRVKTFGTNRIATLWR
ncbi:hypothetical protein [Dyella monticola]|uniref:hypothetical protein n=1 Tax=Dyella monticola TaxID=1927958 RepID=UPI0011C0729A|nr:hypothetical protein [Dyella monticola]